VGDLVPTPNASIRQMMISSVESANALLKQRVKSALQKVWNSATGKANPEKSKPAPDSSKSSNDLLPPHS
jgi:hypothetical protein